MKQFLLLAFLIFGVGCATEQKKTENSDKDVEAPLMTRKHDFSACYDKNTTESSRKSGGNVMTKFTIGPDGKVSKATIEKTTLNQPLVEACILRTIQSIQFSVPKAGGTMEVRYPFKIDPK